MPSLVQHTKAAFNATSSWTITFGSNLTANNRITVQLANANGAVLSGVTDNAAGGSNTYNLDDTKSDATVGGESNAESANITRGGGSALTVTASFTANQSGEGYIQEFSGLDTATNIVRTTGENVDTVGSTAHSATTAAASVSGDLVLGFDNAGATETSISAANGTTLIDSDLSSASVTVWKTAGGTTETAGVTVAPSDTYIFMTIVLKQLAAAVTPPGQVTYAYSSN